MIFFSTSSFLNTSFLFFWQILIFIHNLPSAFSMLVGLVAKYCRKKRNTQKFNWYYYLSFTNWNSHFLSIHFIIFFVLKTLLPLKRYLNCWHQSYCILKIGAIRALSSFCWWRVRLLILGSWVSKTSMYLHWVVWGHPPQNVCPNSNPIVNVTLFINRFLQVEDLDMRLSCI